MRLSKKIAAVALAAVMSVSMLTACGGTDAPSSSNPGSSSSSSSSSSADSSSSSGSSGSASDSSSSSSSSGSSSNSGTEDKEENVAYKNSRTARFYQKLGTSYTLGAKLDVTVNDQSGTADVLIVTNGSRTYQRATIQSNGDAESQTQTMLVDKTKQKMWYLIPGYLIPGGEESLKEQGKLGYCRSVTISGTSTGGDVLDNVMPNEGLKFKQETKGNYYIESQSFAVLTDEGLVEYAIAYYFEGNDSAPKYVDVKASLGGKEITTLRMTFTRIESKADAKYLDFETILNQYIDITDKSPSTVQAHEPSVAGLILG